MRIPAVVYTFLGLGISDSCVVPRPGSFWPIFQQVTLKIVPNLAESIFFKSVCPLRTGEGEGPPPRWPTVGRLVGGHIGRTAKALVRRSGEKVVRVCW